MPVIRARAGGGVHIQPGTYVVTCMDAREDQLENAQYGGGQVIRLEFEVDGQFIDGNPVALDAIANWLLTPKSKLWKWADALGCPPVINEEFDTDCLIDKKAQAVIVDKVSDGATFSRIDDLVPLPRGGIPNAMPPSVINPDGSPNWTVFWAEMKRHGINQKNVYDHLGGGAEAQPKLQALDGIGAQELMDEMTGKVADG